MKIAINALPAKVGAGPTFYRSFLPALAAIDTKNEYLVLVARDQQDLFPIPEPFRRVVVDAPNGYAARFVWEQLALPFLLRKLGVDLLYNQANTVSLFAPCRKVMVITGANQYSRLSFPQTLAYKIKQFALRLVTAASARVTEKVIFISENSRRLIQQRLRLPDERTAVVYYAWEPWTADEWRPPEDDYILMVSLLWPHKNLERLMRAFDLLVERHGYKGSLVLAGGASTPSYFKLLQQLRDELKHGDRIVFTDWLSREQLAGYYRHARAFVFPSLEETFGLPLVEAMGFGLPIAASDASLARNAPPCFNPFPELSGDAAIYFDPFDADDICAAMQRLLADEALRTQLSARARERVGRFTWEAAARGTAQVFAELDPAVAHT